MRARQNNLVLFFVLSLSLHLLLFFSWPKPSKVAIPQTQIPISLLPPPAAPPRESNSAPKPSRTAPSRESKPAPKPPRTAPSRESKSTAAPNAQRKMQKQSPEPEAKRMVSLEDRAVLARPQPEKTDRREEKKPEPPLREAPQSDLRSRPLPTLKELLPPVTWSSRRDRTGDEGPISLNTREPRYLTYFETVKRAIEQVWEYPEFALRSGLEGKLILEFTIMEDGEMVGPRLIHSSGFLELDQEAIRAVRAASPFQPIPASVGRNRIDILASFEYYDNRLHHNKSTR